MVLPGSTREFLSPEIESDLRSNFRTEKAAVARSRVLIVQSIITVANYEYIFMFKFDTAAGEHIERC